MVTRPTKEQWALGVAASIAKRGECTRRQVGCLIVASDGSLVQGGYNGNYPGGPSCLQGACPRSVSDVPSGSSYDTGPGSCIALHAEQNALLRADWSKLPGATMYLTCAPCNGCRKMIKGTPIEWVIWTDDYGTDFYRNSLVRARL